MPEILHIFFQCFSEEDGDDLPNSEYRNQFLGIVIGAFYLRYVSEFFFGMHVVDTWKKNSMFFGDFPKILIHSLYHYFWNFEHKNKFLEIVCQDSVGVFFFWMHGRRTFFFLFFYVCVNTLSEFFFPFFSFLECTWLVLDNFWMFFWRMMMICRKF